MQQQLGKLVHYRKCVHIKNETLATGGVGLVLTILFHSSSMFIVDNVDNKANVVFP